MRVKVVYPMASDVVMAFRGAESCARLKATYLLPSLSETRYRDFHSLYRLSTETCSSDRSSTDENETWTLILVAYLQQSL